VQTDATEVRTVRGRRYRMEIVITPVALCDDFVLDGARPKSPGTCALYKESMGRLPTRGLCLFLAVAFVASCHGSPTGPNEAPLATGRWTGGGSCLSVTETACDLVVGCGHGQFPRPALRADGTFDIGGTYRIEAGPISIEPAPPAQFSGSVRGSSLTLTVSPSAASLPPASYSLTLAGTGRCVVACL
jgi:hypothetical protein